MTPVLREALGLLDSSRGGLDLRQRLVDVGGNHVLSFEELDERLGLLSALLFDAGQVANAETFRLPYELEAGVDASPPLIEAAVGSQAEDSRLDHHGCALEAVEHDNGQQRTHLLLADSGVRGLHHRLPRSELWAVGNGNGHEVVERELGIDQGDLKVVVLDGHHDGSRVEPKDLREIGAADAPGFSSRCRALFELGDQVLGSVDFNGGNEVATERGDSIDKVSAAFHRVNGACVDSAVLVDPEVGVGGHHRARRFSRPERPIAWLREPGVPPVVEKWRR